jgi:dihydropyrimidine dehydrogenase (NAD+) subunit PreA
MADLTTDFLGIKSPNPFWLASAPPTDKEYNVVRAFKAGWGGVVWKTLGEEGPPIVNVNGPRYGAIWGRTGGSWASTTSSSSPTARWR